MNPMVSKVTETVQAAPDVLIVDADQSTGSIVRNTITAADAMFRTVTNLEHAFLEVQRREPTLALINVQMNDGAAVDLIGRLSREYPAVEVIALSRASRSELCIAAWRAGAADMLLQPFSESDLTGRLEQLQQRRESVSGLLKRNRQLRSTCKKLNKARREIGAQVDLLCQDLVKAYQDLAQQLNQTQQTGKLAEFLGDELDIENVLRKTLQWVLKQVGPTNSAIFLPNEEGEFTLGAYLDLDTPSTDVLTDTIAQTIVEQASKGTDFLTWSTDESLAGFNQQLLLGRAWSAAPAFYKDECIAVVVTFRDQKQPFDAVAKDELEAVAAVLGQKITRLVRLHNRLGLPEDDAQD
jgi:DNA-binding response OmpR family regulator